MSPAKVFVDKVSRRSVYSHRLIIIEGLFTACRPNVPPVPGFVLGIVINRNGDVGNGFGQGRFTMKDVIARRKLSKIFSCLAGIVLSVVTILVGDVRGAQTMAAETQAQTVLITGSNRGIGFAFVQVYAAKGWHVIATCRRPKQADDLQDFAKANPNVVIEELDVTDDKEIAALANKYRGTAIDVLVNNAGIMPAFEAVTFDTIDYDKFDFMMAVNAKGPMKVSAAFIDHIAASDQKKIVTMASGEGSIGRVRQGGAYQYRASKAALNMLMRNMSFEVADRGVIIGLLSPGLVDTNGFMNVDLDTLPEEARMPIEMMRKSTVRSPMESATLMVPIIENMTLEDSGVFNHVTGRIMPW